jgi:competence protein ComEC
VAQGTRGVTSAVIDPIRCEGIDPQIRVYAGKRANRPDWSLDDNDDDNNHSLVIRVDFEDASFLFSGDMETPALDDLVARYEGTDVLNVDVWAAGHHGSYNGITDRLMRAMSPEIAVLSVGPHSRDERWTAFRFGHPRDSAIASLERGISHSRPSPRNVMIARGVRDFVSHRMTDAIYATAWDGDVSVFASRDGALQVRTTR